MADGVSPPPKAPEAAQQLDEAPSKNALKKAAKEAAKAEAKAKKKVDRAMNKVTQDMKDSRVNDNAPPRARQGASYKIDLKDVDQGVVTRFPPEPSGYLHIGHAKAALLNDYFAHEQYDGTLLLRFDDTNPRNEKEEYQDAIVEDLALMGIRPDRVSYTSDYFEELYQYCIALIKSGDAYAEDAEKSVMDELRKDRKKSARRDESVEMSLSRFEEMKSGSPEGQRWCIRAKIDYCNSNGALRDPVIYRCIVESKDEETGAIQKISHHRTGTKWKIYPTYDFCCPIVDSLEGVTHALRTIEYRDRNQQYDWVLRTLNLRSVHIWDFARMNFVRTLLSKRKLGRLVASGAVYGWDDPRFPTIRGIRRRGMTVPALREFMLFQGPSRNIVNMDWTTFWATNKKYIDPVAPRHTAIILEDAVKCSISGANSDVVIEDKPKHKKNADVGTKKVVYSDTIWLDQVDARSFSQDEEITLMDWGNAIVEKVTTSSSDLVTSLDLKLHLQGDFKKTEKKICWLSHDQSRVMVELVDFDFLITKDKLEEGDELEDFLTPQTEFRVDAFADCNVAKVKAGDIIQFERKGYYRCDRAVGTDGSPAVFFNIPTGKGK